MSDQFNDGGSAFPEHIAVTPDGGLYSGAPGMALRDYFAAQALAGLLADIPQSMYGLAWQRNVAEGAYQLADAMLAARGAE